MDLQHTKEARRRSPGWVRQLESRNVHALAFRLRVEFQQSDWSEPQRWLFDACVSELEYRRRRAIRCRALIVCSCELCQLSDRPDEVALPGYEL